MWHPFGEILLIFFTGSSNYKIKVWNSESNAIQVTFMPLRDTDFSKFCFYFKTKISPLKNQKIKGTVSSLIPRSVCTPHRRKRMMGFTDFLVWYYHLYRKAGFLAPGSRVSAHSQSWNLTPLLLALRWKKMGGRAQLQLSSWELNEVEGQAGWAVPFALEDSWGEKNAASISVKFLKKHLPPH